MSYFLYFIWWICEKLFKTTKMSWFAEDKRSWAQKTFGKILKQGALPRHVALIMDGNRRFARTRKIEKIEGHISGFDKLVEVCQNWREKKFYFFFHKTKSSSSIWIGALRWISRRWPRMHSALKTLNVRPMKWMVCSIWRERNFKDCLTKSSFDQFRFK